MFKKIDLRSMLKRLSLIVTISYIPIVQFSFYNKASSIWTALCLFIPLMAIIVQGMVFMQSIKKSSDYTGKNINMNLFLMWIIIFVVQCGLR